MGSGNCKKGKVCIRARRPIRPALYSGFCSMKRLGIFYSPLDGVLDHRKITPLLPSIVIAGAHLHTWVKRDNVKKSFLSKEKIGTQRLGSNQQPPDQKSNALTTRPPRLHTEAWQEGRKRKITPRPCRRSALVSHFGLV